MLAINSFLAFCVIVILVPVLVAAITLLLRRRVGVVLVVLATSALALSCMMVMLLQPVYVEDNRKCRFGGTEAQYLVCKAERRAQGYRPSVVGTITIVVVPTAVGVAGSMIVLHSGDRRKGRT